jgi:F0F1-type ATP synthase assembly protein I
MKLITDADRRRRAIVVGGIALEMVLSPVIGVILGSYLDGRFATKPWLLLAGTLLGFFSAVRMGIRLFKIGKEAMNEKEPLKEDKEDEKDG